MEVHFFKRLHYLCHFGLLDELEQNRDIIYGDLSFVCFRQDQLVDAAIRLDRRVRLQGVQLHRDTAGCHDTPHLAGKSQDVFAVHILEQAKFRVA